MARTVCYSQFNLTSDHLLSVLMWFLCRFWHITVGITVGTLNLAPLGT